MGALGYVPSPNQARNRGKEAKGQICQSADRTAGEKVCNCSKMLEDVDLDIGEELTVDALPS